jgi:hypothetical protein
MIASQNPAINYLAGTTKLNGEIADIQRKVWLSVLGAILVLAYFFLAQQPLSGTLYQAAPGTGRINFQH